ncbi:hypothetical protein BESB_070990 [Besnoitia besnoiti]|uniref:Uncharacterized protein n=1 Tax=Besnoitia besnoiti TaxID=94643 RepID=A0A2A9ME94_BESBE|nr:uncharacterized protein BESB_070990 [Besnoitia besnoiti]PFH33947.1 hypothetical protein BESB_070990 [Besnoitia besnoiti]
MSLQLSHSWVASVRQPRGVQPKRKLFSAGLKKGLFERLNSGATTGAGQHAHGQSQAPLDPLPLASSATAAMAQASTSSGPEGHLPSDGCATASSAAPLSPDARSSSPFVASWSSSPPPWGVPLSSPPQLFPPPFGASSLSTPFWTSPPSEAPSQAPPSPTYSLGQQIWSFEDSGKSILLKARAGAFEFTSLLLAHPLRHLEQLLEGASQKGEAERDPGGAASERLPLPSSCPACARPSVCLRAGDRIVVEGATQSGKTLLLRQLAAEIALACYPKSAPLNCDSRGRGQGVLVLSYGGDVSLLNIRETIEDMLAEKLQASPTGAEPRAHAAPLKPARVARPSRLSEAKRERLAVRRAAAQALRHVFVISIYTPLQLLHVTKWLPFFCATHPSVRALLVDGVVTTAAAALAASPGGPAQTFFRFAPCGGESRDPGRRERKRRRRGETANSDHGDSGALERRGGLAASLGSAGASPASSGGGGTGSKPATSFSRSAAPAAAASARATPTSSMQLLTLAVQQILRVHQEQRLLLVYTKQTAASAAAARGGEGEAEPGDKRVAIPLPLPRFAARAGDAEGSAELPAEARSLGSAASRAAPPSEEARERQTARGPGASPSRGDRAADTAFHRDSLWTLAGFPRFPRGAVGFLLRRVASDAWVRATRQPVSKLVSCLHKSRARRGSEGEGSERFARGAAPRRASRVYQLQLLKAESLASCGAQPPEAVTREGEPPHASTFQEGSQSALTGTVLACVCSCSSVGGLSGRGASGDLRRSQATHASAAAGVGSAESPDAVRARVVCAVAGNTHLVANEDSVGACLLRRSSEAEGAESAAKPRGGLREAPRREEVEGGASGLQERGGGAAALFRRSFAESVAEGSDVALARRQATGGTCGVFVLLTKHGSRDVVQLL